MIMASEAMTWGERMGGSGEAGPAVALNSIPCCGDVEATEDPDLPERSSMTLSDLDDFDETNKITMNILTSPILMTYYKFRQIPKSISVTGAQIMLRNPNLAKGL